MITIDLLLYILAVIFFAMAGAGVPRYAWQWFAAACLALSLIV